MRCNLPLVLVTQLLRRRSRCVAVCCSVVQWVWLCYSTFCTRNNEPCFMTDAVHSAIGAGNAATLPS